MASKLVRTVVVSGARPNFMKVAPIIRALKKRSLFEPRLIHTGQHYDDDMALRFFRDLGLEKPDTDLEVGSLSHAKQTAAVLHRFDEYLDRNETDLILVVGDVNSTIACALAAVKRGIVVGHVEAGLRSYDREMPEEINRVLTDAIADLLFTTERSAEANLLREGIAPEKIHFVGNVMVDTLLANRERALALPPVEGRIPGEYGLVTLHRPSNVDEKTDLVRMTGILTAAARKIPLLFPVHPRTRERLDRFGLNDQLASDDRIELLPPQGYLEFLRLLAEARLVLTDSGGIQEETTALGIPCLTLRENTERPITVDEGTNVVCGSDREKILERIDRIVEDGGKTGRVPELWDGLAAERIADVLEERFL